MENNEKYFDYGDFLLLTILISLLASMFFLIKMELKERGTLTEVKATIISKKYIPKKVIQYEKFYLYKGWKIEEDVYPAEYWLEYKYNENYKEEKVEEYTYNFYDIGDTREIKMYIKGE